MKYSFKFLFILFACFSVLAINKFDMEKQKNYYIRVLLSEKKLPDDFTWQIESQDGFFLSDDTKESKVIYCKSKNINIAYKNKFIFVNDKKYLKENLKISPKSGDLSFDGNSYHGDFIISFDMQNLLLINKLHLEDYVFAVLRAESWPGWPLEVNKVFAVIIRTYAVKRIKEAKNRNRPYDIKNTNSHQTYRGYKYEKRNSDLLQKAVEQTSGILLMFNGKIIDPLYDSCCGSVIPSKIEGKIDFGKEPCLARNYACKYCKKCSLYNWEVDYKLSDFENLLSKQFPEIKNIKSIWVSKKDKAGLVKEIKIKCARDTFKISGKKLYSILKGVKSFCFSLKKTGNSVKIVGRGFGHHVGLCQWGARQMVREFFDYKQILQFYYPGTSFVRLV